MQIDTSLLREKFVIKEKTADKSNMAAQEMCARSNRIVLNLQTKELSKETFIIRADSMHLCARMAGHILANYENKGPFSPRLKYLKWDIIWDSALSDYERRYNIRRWVAIYHKGKLVFSQGDHHAFLDIIEQFQNRDDTGYSESLGLAEKAFQKAGREVTIEYSSNVALAIMMDSKGGRCSTILRAPNKTTAFHYYIKPKNNNEKVVVSQGLTSAANFLEGMNLSYFIGITNAQLEMEKIEKYSDEAIQLRHARSRLGEIYIKTSSLENRYAVRYRPERPMFDLIIEHTENLTKKQILENSKR
jgi:hypothetical protein